MLEDTEQSKTAQSLLDMLARYQEMEEIIEQIWLEMGPYNERDLSTEVIQRLRKFMEFDDSE